MAVCSRMSLPVTVMNSVSLVGRVVGDLSPLCRIRAIRPEALESIMPLAAEPGAVVAHHDAIERLRSLITEIPGDVLVLRIQRLTVSEAERLIGRHLPGHRVANGPGVHLMLVGNHAVELRPNVREWAVNEKLRPRARSTHAYVCQ